ELLIKQSPSSRGRNDQHARRVCSPMLDARRDERIIFIRHSFRHSTFGSRHLIHPCYPRLITQKKKRREELPFPALSSLLNNSNCLCLYFTPNLNWPYYGASANATMSPPQLSLPSAIRTCYLRM